MAKISAHGTELGTVYFTTSAKRYMSDGTILRNQGFGWKLGPKLKPEFTIQEALARQQAKQTEFLVSHPEIANYRKLLHSICGMSLRWKLDAAVSMMPEDCDGVWSECCDGYGDNIHADLDEIAELCRAYLAIPTKQTVEA